MVHGGDLRIKSGCFQFDLWRNAFYKVESVKRNDSNTGRQGVPGCRARRSWAKLELEPQRIWQCSITDTRGEAHIWKRTDSYEERGDRYPIPCVRTLVPVGNKTLVYAARTFSTEPPKQGRMRLLISPPLAATYRGSTIRNRLFMVKKGGQIF